jgi:uncharacterized protein (TIGR03000 family)
MRLRVLALLALPLSLALLPGRQLQTAPGRQGDGKQVTLKLLLPHPNAKVTVDGVARKGKGKTRTVTLAPGKGFVKVEATWQPNGYTQITRPRKVVFKGGGPIEVDLREQDPRQPDDIVVIFVPTPDDVVEAMCKMAKVGKADVVYDLGCGDGRMVITAVKKFGARRGVGIDLDPNRVRESKENARKAGVADKVEFRQGDVLKVDDLGEATVVLLYMGDDINLRLRPILRKTLRPGARVVSHRFLMGDWKPDRSELIESEEGYECRIHLWVIRGEKK